MNLHKTLIVFAIVIALAMDITEAKRRRSNKSAQKTKTKTKWSTSSDGLSESPQLLATEEHSYYIKRTFLPSTGNGSESVVKTSMKSPPYLAIPIAWFQCEKNDASCVKGNTALINSGMTALSEGYLCDDDCDEPYSPICGKSASEVAVFYNECKLNVAKCRTHGLWTTYPYEECKKAYPKEVQYTDKKFKSSPFFKKQKGDAMKLPATASTPVTDKTSLIEESQESETKKKNAKDMKDEDQKPIDSSDLSDTSDDVEKIVMLDQ